MCVTRKWQLKGHATKPLVVCRDRVSAKAGGVRHSLWPHARSPIGSISSFGLARIQEFPETPVSDIRVKLPAEELRTFIRFQEDS